MITKHHADKILLPDPSPYQKKFSALLYAAKHYGFEDGDNMVGNLLHIMYKLVKLQVLYEYIVEVLQMLPAPNIEVGLQERSIEPRAPPGSLQQAVSRSCCS